MSDWESKRRRLNHDVLKNQFLQSLSRIIRILEGRIDENGLPKDMCQKLSVAWNSLNTEAQKLLDSAEDEMSPATWFLQYPLNQLNMVDRAWMETLLVSEFKLSSDLTLSETRLLLNDIHLSYRKLLSSLALLEDNKPKAKTHREVIDTEALIYALELYEKCQQLSNQLSKLSSQDVMNVLSKIGHVTSI